MTVFVGEKGAHVHGFVSTFFFGSLHGSLFSTSTTLKALILKVVGLRYGQS